MHDPLTVAFEIPRPWPRRDRIHDAKPGRSRWRARYQWATWRKPWAGWTRFWTVAGRGYYWPSLVTVWHVEPGGHDSGEVCPHYRRWQDEQGQWQVKFLRGWKWHVHHWRIQVPPLQELRRRLLTRCEWCRGRSTKADPVNCTLGWDSSRGPWWRGARGVFHSECTSVHLAHRLCFCERPELSHREHGQCARCGRSRAWRQVPDDADRLLASLPPGGRPDAATRERLEVLWAQRRAAREAAEAS